MIQQFGSCRLISRAVLDAAVSEAAEAGGVGAAEILSLSRARAIVAARHHAMWLLRQPKMSDGSARYSYSEIAVAFGLKDHTTAWHADRAHARRAADPQVSICVWTGGHVAGEGPHLKPAKRLMVFA